MAKQFQIITRADDAGSSRSANRAIAKAARIGIIKNISVMAPGAYVDEAAQLLAANKAVCFGMHATLNAEWDRVKWGPVGALPPGSGLTDENGMFLSGPAQFQATKPPPELVMREYGAQLDKLCRAGFDIRYVDSHMFPEQYIEGLDEATADWAGRKGLLDHMHYYALPPGLDALLRDRRLLPFLRGIPAGQYFIVGHPARGGREMRMTGNAWKSGRAIARERGLEAALYGSGAVRGILRALGVTPLRYDEAVPGERLTAADVLAMLGQLQQKEEEHGNSPK